MTMQIDPYLSFEGRCDEAIELYRGALDAEVEMVMRFEESPDPVPCDQMPEGWEKKVMHSSLRIGGALLMASDGMGQEPGFKGINLCLTVQEAETAERYFNDLADGGQVVMPLGETFWSPLFGMVTDRFGVSWMITLPTKET